MYGLSTRRFRKLDQFGEGFRMKLDGGVDKLKSNCGSCSTVFMVVLVGFYMALKINTIVASNDIDVFSAMLNHEIT